MPDRLSQWLQTAIQKLSQTPNPVSQKTPTAIQVQQAMPTTPAQTVSPEQTQLQPPTVEEPNLGPVRRFIDDQALKAARVYERSIGGGAELQKRKLENEAQLAGIRAKGNQFAMDHGYRSVMGNLIMPLQGAVTPLVTKAIQKLKPSEKKLDAARRAEGWPVPEDIGDL